MKACLDLHDWSFVHSRMHVLRKLKNYFPDFKVSLFTVPIDEKQDWGAYTIIGNRIKFFNEGDYAEWIQIVPHGLYHTRLEMHKSSYEMFKNSQLPAIEGAFEASKISYEKGFCAPHWRWSEGVVKVLDEEGWWGAIDRDMVMPCPKKFYQYNFLLNEPFWRAEGDLKLHGHVYGTRNDVGLCFENLLKLPRDTKWGFVTDFLEDKK